MLEESTRLRCARSFDKNEQQATQKALKIVAERGMMSSPPPLVSDGHNGCGQAMLDVWGKIPQYKGVGPYPIHKKAGEDWQHLKVIKNNEAKEISAFCEKKVVFGQEEEVLNLLKNGTVHLERTHLTMRNFDARITRKGLGVSKKHEMHLLTAALEDIYYNLCHEVRTLKTPLFEPQKMEEQPRFTAKWRHLTPMMAANITDHKWSVKEFLLTLPISPSPSTL